MPLHDALHAPNGRWHLHASTFPMWLKGDRQQPCFNYRVITDGEGWALDDRVTWQKNGHERSINGISRPLDEDASHFKWRGRGWLAIASSRWEIFHPDPRDYDTAVVVFSRTLLTPAGADVIARGPELSEQNLHAIADAMRAHPSARSHVDALLRLPG